MSTTTIRLPDGLKQRVAKAAERAGISPHSFILDAVREKTAAEEVRQDFHAVAEKRYNQLLATSESIPWSDMRSYLLQRAQDKSASRPKPKKLPQ